MQDYFYHGKMLRLVDGLDCDIPIINFNSHVTGTPFNSVSFKTRQATYATEF